MILNFLCAVPLVILACLFAFIVYRDREDRSAFLIGGLVILAVLLPASRLCYLAGAIS